MNIRKLSIVSVVVAAAIALSGCSGSAKPAETPIPATSQKAAPAPAAETSDTYAFGSTAEWPDGVKIKVSVPKEFKPSEYAAGVTQGNKNLLYTVTMLNGSDEKISPSTLITVSSGGVEGSSIFDDDLQGHKIGFQPMTDLLPGKSITWIVGYSVIDPKDVTMEISSGFHDKIYYTTDVK